MGGTSSVEAAKIWKFWLSGRGQFVNMTCGALQAWQDHLSVEWGDPTQGSLSGLSATLSPQGETAAIV